MSAEAGHGMSSQQFLRAVVARAEPPISRRAKSRSSGSRCGRELQDNASPPEILVWKGMRLPLLQERPGHEVGHLEPVMFSPVGHDVVPEVVAGDERS